MMLVNKKIIVTSIPKSGTYLLSEVLKNLGFIQTYMHIGLENVDFYDSARLEEGRRDPSQFRKTMNLESSLRLIPDSGFAVGHLAHDKSVLSKVESFNVIFLKRNLKDCLISQMRFFAETGRKNSTQADWFKEQDPQKKFTLFLKAHAYKLFKAYYRVMVDWENEPSVYSLKFEDMRSADGYSSWLNDLTNHIGYSEQSVSCDVIVNALNAQTLTKSSGKVSRDTYWSQDAEDIFEKLGGNLLNTKLGY